jgi:two-component system NtrC family sensor kinase
MYDNRDSLAYSTFSFDTVCQSNPDCMSCHPNIKEMFPQKKKSYRIIDEDSDCCISKNGSGHRHLIIRTPIFNELSCYTAACHAHSKEEEVLGSLIIKLPLKDIDDAMNESTTDFYLLATLTTIVLLVFLILFTNKRIKNPLTAIINASEAVSKGDRSARLPITPNLLDDMRMVSLAFNNMLDNLDKANKELENWSHQLEYKVQKKSEELSEIQSELIHVEKIASLGKLSSSVAHEINNPLSGVLTYTKLVQKQLNKLNFEESVKESMLKSLKVIERETKRCGDIVKGLLDFSRKDQQHFTNRNLHAILQETYDLMAHQMKMANIRFTTYFKARSDLTNCNENQIKQACIAILVNSLEAISDNGEIQIITSNPDENNIRVDIVDNGAGIATEDIPHIFEPFFSAKRKASGIGLGLAIVHGIVQNHKGKIEVDSEPGTGTTISIILPLFKN